MGKSSLFNRILGRRAAVVSDRDGVTRDRHYQTANYKGHEFTVVDTGGFLPDDSIDVLADSVRTQIFNAVEEADLVLFMVDVRVGITKLDEQFARMIRKLDKKVILVANKSENGADRQESYEFLKLGFGLPRTISALTGYACLSLMDEVIAVLPTPVRGERREERPIRFAILGRPNAGKSTLLNRLLNEDRAVVSDIPGTTRDSIDCDFAVDGQKFVVTDTAGLRKKAKVEDEVEIFSNMRTLESIRRSDVSVLMVDCTRGLEVQDFRIITEIRKAGKGLVLVLNKWDIFPDKTEKSFDHMVKEMLEREPMLEYVPIISASAKEGQRVNRIVQAIQTVYANCRRVLGRDRVATAFASFLEKNPVPSQNARTVQLTRACQIMVEPPVIAIETRTPELVADSYKRYLLKQFYEEFQLQGAPLRLNFDQKLTLRKDEDLEQFTESSNSVLAGVNPEKPALPVVFMDLIKGILGPWIAMKMCEAQVATGGADYSHWVPLVAGLLVILGHSFTCFAGFRGGKGVLAALGVFLALCPITALSAFGVWIVFTFASKYVSVGSIAACVALGVFAVMGYLKLPFPPDDINLGLMITCLIVAVFVIVKHKSNIKRLMNGTENGFGSKRKTPKA